MKLRSAEDYRKAFGRAVRRHRAALRPPVSQEALADSAGLHRTFMSSIERGLQNASLDTLVKVAAALHVPLSKLMATMEEELKKSG